MENRGKNVNADRKNSYGRGKHMDDEKKDFDDGRTTLVIEGNAVYELDEACLKRKKRD